MLTRFIPSYRSILLPLAAAAFCLAGPALAQDDDEDTGEDIAVSSTLNDVANEHVGVLQLNQDSGNGVNQSNALSIAYAANGAALSTSTSATSQSNLVISAGPDAVSSGVSLTNAVNESSGLIAINQSSAQGSSQINTVSVAIVDEERGLAVAINSAGTAHTSDSGLEGLLTTLRAGNVTMSNVGLGSSGIMTINQDAGIGSSQANVISLASAPGGIALASAIGGGATDDEARERIVMDALPAGGVSIADSFNGASGLVQLNQNSGGYNRQSNVLAAAFGNYADATAVSDVDLGVVLAGQAPANGDAAEDAPIESLQNSFDGFSGLAQVSQVSGHNNAVSNALSISVLTVPAGGL